MIIAFLPEAPAQVEKVGRDHLLERWSLPPDAVAFRMQMLTAAVVSGALPPTWPALGLSGVALQT